MSSTNCMTVTDICQIIECCNKNNVVNCKYENLELSFNKVSEIPTELDSTPSQTDKTTIESIGRCQDDLDEDTNTIDKAEEFAMLHITDPEKYEEILADPSMLSDFEKELDNKGILQ